MVSKIITLRMPQELLERVDHECGVFGVHRSDWIRDAIESTLPKRRTDDRPDPGVFPATSLKAKPVFDVDKPRDGIDGHAVGCPCTMCRAAARR